MHSKSPSVMAFCLVCLGILAKNMPKHLAGYYLLNSYNISLGGYALLTGVFKQINFMGLGVQIDVYAEHMTNMQLGIFCLVGALATFCVGYLLVALAKNICRAQSKLLRAMLYYITIAFYSYPEFLILPVIPTSELYRLFKKIPLYQWF